LCITQLLCSLPDFVAFLLGLQLDPGDGGDVSPKILVYFHRIKRRIIVLLPFFGDYLDKLSVSKLNSVKNLVHSCRIKVLFPWTKALNLCLIFCIEKKMSAFLLNASKTYAKFTSASYQFGV
jgi:hypothetical protein